MKRTAIRFLIFCIVMTLMATMAISASASGAPEELYPTEVVERRDDDGWHIIRVYELGPGENPANIPRGSFMRSGWRFTLADITKNETTITTTKDHVETYYVDTETDDIDEIIAMLQPSIEFETLDGYEGVLTLNKRSVTTDVTETRNVPWTMTVTREYPHMISNDTSLIPKTVIDRNMEYTLTNVSWRAGNTTTVDYVAIPDYYTAIATYSRSGSSTRAVAHMASVTYEGVLTKIEDGKTVYSAHFIGEEVQAVQEQTPQVPVPSPIQVEDIPDPEPDETLPPSTAIDVNVNNGTGGNSLWWLLIFIPIVAGLGFGGYLFWKKQNERPEEDD